MSETFHVLDVVAVTEDLPGHGLRRGQVGTIVDVLSSDTFEVEFSDNLGHPYAMIGLHADHLLALHHEPLQA